MEALSKVQASAEDLSFLTSITSVQTKGLKSLFSETDKSSPKKLQYAEEDDVQHISSVAGSRKKKYLQLTDETPQSMPNDPNIVGLEVSANFC